MKAIYYIILTAAYLLMPVNMSAQNDRKMVLHMKDNTTQKISIASIDSISFEGQNPGEKAPFTAKMETISELYTTLQIIPDDLEMTYNMMCEPKEAIDLYPKDEAIYKDDRLYYQELADGYGMSLTEILSSFLLQGEWNDFNTALLPGTEYVLYMYGMSMEGDKTTPMLKVYFTTKAPEMISNKIDIKYSFKGDAIEATYVPDDNNRYFTAGLFAAADVPDFTKIGTKLQQSISNIIVDFVLNEEPLAEYLERYASKGVQEMKFTGSDPNQVYYLVAAYLDDDCGICSDITVEAVTGGDMKTKLMPRTRSFRSNKVLRSFKSAK